MIYTIYKITSTIDNKVYIGYTSNSIAWRLYKHLEESKKLSDNRKFYQAIREHGNDNFYIDAIYQSKDKIHTLNEMENHFIDEYNSIELGYNTRRGGGGGHIVSSRFKSVDVYDKDKNLLHTFFSCADADRFLKLRMGSSAASANFALKGKSSQYKGHWFCFSGLSPVYKIVNSLPGCLAAAKINKGKKRPKHSEYMKQYNKDHAPIYHIPEGSYTLNDAKSFYGRDMLIEWCRNNSNKIVSKMMIIKSKHLSIEQHSHWIGKSRKSLGFSYEAR